MADAFTVVHDVDFEKFLTSVVAHVDLHNASRSELKRVLNKVDQDLFETYLIPHQSIWQICTSYALKESMSAQLVERDNLTLQLCSRELRLGMKHGLDVVKDRCWCKQFDSGLVLACFNHLEVEDVINQAK